MPVNLARAAMTLGLGGAVGALVATQALLVRRLVGLDAAASTDPLTGLPNRRYLDRIEPVPATAGAAGWIAYIDVDGFKAVNDELGHAAGDSVLVSVAVALTGAVRCGDVVCRVGGDEFVVVLAPCHPDSATTVADRMRQAVPLSLARWSIARWPAIPPTVSIGLCPVGPANGGADPIATTIAFADRAMLAAKQAGGNRVVMWERPPGSSR